MEAAVKPYLLCRNLAGVRFQTFSNGSRAEGWPPRRGGIAEPPFGTYDRNLSGLQHSRSVIALRMAGVEDPAGASVGEKSNALSTCASSGVNFSAT